MSNDIPDIHSLARDSELVGIISDTVDKLPGNNLYRAFFVKLTENRGRNTKDRFEIGKTIAELADKHPINFDIPANPGEIPTATLQKYLLAFDNQEMNALGAAGGITSDMGRRSFMRSTAGLITGALVAGGSIGYMVGKKDTPPSQQQPPSGNMPVPDPGTLLMVGGAMVAMSLLQNARRRRRENPTVDYAMQHLPETLTEILVEQDKQIKAAMTQKAARSSSPAR